MILASVEQPLGDANQPDRSYPASQQLSERFWFCAKSRVALFVLEVFLLPHPNSANGGFRCSKSRQFVANHDSY